MNTIGLGAPSSATTRPPRGRSDIGVISSTLLPLVGVQTWKPLIGPFWPPPAALDTVQPLPLATAAELELVSHTIGQGWPVLSKKLTAVG